MGMLLSRTLSPETFRLICAHTFQIHTDLKAGTQAISEDSKSPAWRTGSSENMSE